ncbi:hypothetical protein D3C81_506670 [compost metagenome]
MTLDVFFGDDRRTQGLPRFALGGDEGVLDDQGLFRRSHFQHFTRAWLFGLSGGRDHGRRRQRDERQGQAVG